MNMFWWPISNCFSLVHSKISKSDEWIKFKWVYIGSMAVFACAFFVEKKFVHLLLGFQIKTWIRPIRNLDTQRVHHQWFDFRPQSVSKRREPLMKADHWLEIERISLSSIIVCDREFSLIQYSLFDANHRKRPPNHFHFLLITF